MLTKTYKVKMLVAAGDYKAALSICKDWNRVDITQRDILRRGYECLHYPEFYRQLNIDPEEHYLKAVELLQELYK